MTIDWGLIDTALLGAYLTLRSFRLYLISYQLAKKWWSPNEIELHHFRSESVCQALFLPKN